MFQMCHMCLVYPETNAFFVVRSHHLAAQMQRMGFRVCHEKYALVHVGKNGGTSKK